MKVIPLGRVARINVETLDENTFADLEISYVDLASADLPARRVIPRLVRFEEAPSRARRLAAPGDTLIPYLVNSVSWMGTRPLLISGELARNVYSTGFFSVSPGPTLDPRFLNFVLSGQQALAHLEARARGVTMIAYSEDELRRIPVPHLSLEDQRAIADFLDRETARIDALIAKKQRLLGTVKEREAAWVERTVLGIERESAGASSTGFFVHCPMGWAETTIRHLGCEVQTGPFGSQLHAEEYVKDGWPVVNPANLQKGEIVPIREMSISDEKRAQLSRHILRPGDIVFGRRGEMGRAGLVEAKHEGWLCGTGSVRLRLQHSPLKPEYLKLLLETKALRTYFELTSIGSTMDNLNSEIILGLPCVVPSEDEQWQIVTAVARRARTLKAFQGRLEQQLALLTEHRQALITAAVTGQMEVPSAA